MGNDIHVWTDDADGAAKAAVPRAITPTSRVATVSPETVAENLRQFLLSIQPVVAVDLSDSNFLIDEVELNLTINAKGGIELIGKLEVGSESSIKVRLKRRSASGKFDR